MLELHLCNPNVKTFDQIRNHPDTYETKKLVQQDL